MLSWPAFTGGCKAENSSCRLTRCGGAVLPCGRAWSTSLTGARR